MICQSLKSQDSIYYYKRGEFKNYIQGIDPDPGERSENGLLTFHRKTYS
jgi:hypothetical protein